MKFAKEKEDKFKRRELPTDYLLLSQSMLVRKKLPKYSVCKENPDVLIDLMHEQGGITVNQSTICAAFIFAEWLLQNGATFYISPEEKLPCVEIFEKKYCVEPMIRLLIKGGCHLPNVPVSTPNLQHMRRLRNWRSFVFQHGGPICEDEWGYVFFDTIASIVCAGIEEYEWKPQGYNTM